MKQYDLIIVGAGPSGIFTALELKKLNPKVNILMLEKGNPITKRKCLKREAGKCASCTPCNIISGFSGAGAFSDGKLSINEHGEIGGNLIEYIGPDTFKEVLHYTDQIYLNFGADPKVYGLENSPEFESIRRKTIQSNIRIIESGIRHLGTEKAYDIYKKIQHHLEKLKVEMLFNTPVIDFIIENNTIIGVTTEKGNYYAKKVVVGVGRDGSQWLKNLCEKYNIDTEVGAIDIGIRLECDSAITKQIDEITYESKLVNFSKTFDDKVRTFCWNPRGEVTEERYDNQLSLVNGHSYKDDKLKTNNTNFALLVSLKFTEPFKTPIEYGKHIASLANMLSGGKVLVQRYGDFKRGRRTTIERLARNNIRPTLKDAVPGDLSLVLPYRIMLDIVETIEALDNIMEGLASESTLLYGVEAKFYSNKIKVTGNFETTIKNLHVLGDGAGITRGLIQASMNGVVFARQLVENKNHQ
ncbi:MAG: NAD(P)/FAD-dependent oxidoreductase [Bacilli bacterium]